FGKDTTGNFKQTLIGIAVKGADSFFNIIHDGGRIEKLTDVFGIPGADDYIFRIPVLLEDLRKDDLLVLDDDNQGGKFKCLLYEGKGDKGGITGWVQDGTLVTQALPDTIFGVPVYAKVVGLLDGLLDKKEIAGITPILTAMNPGTPPASPAGDPASAYLLAK